MIEKTNFDKSSFPRKSVAEITRTKLEKLNLNLWGNSSRVPIISLGVINGKSAKPFFILKELLFENI